jgi:hypothetical protein
VNSRFSERLLQIAADGSVESRITLGGVFDQRRLVAGGIVTAGVPSGVRLLGMDGQLARDLGELGAAPEPLLMCLLPARRLVILSRTSASGYWVDLNGSLLTRFVVSAPAIEARKLKYGMGASGSTRSKTAIVNGLASDRSGRVYLNLSGIRLEEGAEVLVLSSSGELLRTLRCRLPKFSRRRAPENREGHLAPSLISVHADTLYLLDRAGIVASYRVKEGS